jgi:hypothetical protein
MMILKDVFWNKNKNMTKKVSIPSPKSVKKVQNQGKTIQSANKKLKTWLLKLTLPQKTINPITTINYSKKILPFLKNHQFKSSPKYLTQRKRRLKVTKSRKKNNLTSETKLFKKTLCRLSLLITVKTSVIAKRPSRKSQGSRHLLLSLSNKNSNSKNIVKKRPTVSYQIERLACLETTLNAIGAWSLS